MLIKSLINKSYIPERYKSNFIFRGFGKNDVPRFEEIKTEILKLKIGEQLGLISQCPYEYKDGFFYIVINIKGETFTLLQNEIDFNNPILYKKITFVNKIPSIIDCIEIEIFDLDNL